MSIERQLQLHTIQRGSVQSRGPRLSPKFSSQDPRYKSLPPTLPSLFFIVLLLLILKRLFCSVGKTERQDYVAILFQWLKFLLFRYITSIAWVRGEVSEIRIRDSAHFYAAIPSPCFVQQNRVNTRPTCPKVSRQPPRQPGSIKDRYKKNTI